MKKGTKVIITVVIIVLLACTGVSTFFAISYRSKWETDEVDKQRMSDDYDGLSEDNDKLQGKYDDLKSDYDSLSNDYEELSTSYDELYEEVYGDPDEESSIPDFDTPESLDDYRTDITYDNLARTPDDYYGEPIKMSGKVVQVSEGDGETDLRVAVNSDYDDIIYLFYDSSITSERVLEDDKITFYGISLGLYSYEATSGATITIPLAYVTSIERN
jgi:hypothetical protein